MAAVNAATTGGGWVLLENTHLSLRFCTDLAELIRRLRLKGQGAFHESFKLWMTTAPHPKFSVALLHLGFHMSDEPPRGIRAAMSRSMRTVTQDQLDSIPVREWRMILYAAAFLHAVLVERKKFGSIGWACRYDFTAHDLAVANLYLYNHMYNESKKGLMWKNVQYMWL